MAEGTIVHIPARAGSHRLKNKNVQPLGGHPLIAYTIRAALLMDGVDRVIVNTDSEEYAAIAREYGAETPFIRPKDLAAKNSSLVGAVDHALYQLRREGYEVRQLVTMLPTSPFRNVRTLNRLMEMMDSLMSLRTVLWTALEHESCLVKVDEGFVGYQDMLDIKLNGAYAWIKPLSYFFSQRLNQSQSELCFYNNHGYYYLRNPIELVDIDTCEDFELAKAVVCEGLYDFGANLF